MMATSKWRRLLVGIGLALGMLLVTSVAAARGTVRLRSTSIDESNGTWKLKFTIDYGGRPPSAYIPMIFSFKPTMLYERSLTDQSPKTPVERRVPLRGPMGRTDELPAPEYRVPAKKRRGMQRDQGNGGVQLFG